MTKLIEITGKALSGEWGTEDETGSGIPVLRTTNFTNEGVVDYDNVITRCITKKNIEDKYLRNGDIILEKSGGSDKQPVGRVVFFDGPEKTYLFNNFTGLLRVKNTSNWYPRYVFYSLLSNYLSGGTRKYENKTTGLHNLQADEYVSNFNVKDASLNTQKQICYQLDRVSNIIRQRNDEIASLDTLTKARFVELTDSAEHRSIKMGDIATYINGYAFKPNDWSEQGKPIIRIQNLNNADAEYNHFDGKIDEKYLVQPEDVLVSWATHLEAYIWHGPDAWLNQHIFKVEFNKMKMNKRYFVLAADNALKIAFRNAHGFKPTMEHIKREDFENAIVNIPDYSTQMRFSNFAAQVDKSKLLKSTIRFC